MTHGQNASQCLMVLKYVTGDVMDEKQNNDGWWIVMFFIITGAVYMNVNSDQDTPSNTDTCLLKGMPYEAVEPSLAALKAINRITLTMGIHDDFKVIGGKFLKTSPIAAAFICKGVRHIIYDVEKYNWFETGKTDWSSLGTLAHEIGHHVGSHLFVRNQTSHERELQADYLAAFALGRLGATLKEALSTNRDLSENGSSTHPPKAKRDQEVMQGWLDADAQKAWERQQCVRDDWSGESFPLYGQQCRVVNFCSGGKVAPRIACHKTDNRWVIQG